MLDVHRETRGSSKRVALDVIEGEREGSEIVVAPQVLVSRVGFAIEATEDGGEIIGGRHPRHLNWFFPQHSDFCRRVCIFCDQQRPVSVNRNNNVKN